jgi:signal transduction histidine kinase
LAQNKGLEFNSSVTPDVPATLYGDAQRLQQIMINLVGNAIKFTKTGQVCLNLSRPDKQSWVIQVVDTGAGIPKEALDYIFEPFRQVDNSITRENRGTGLGLSITKQLVELMGGRITVESKVDQGSTFSVALPILEKLEDAV